MVSISLKDVLQWTGGKLLNEKNISSNDVAFTGVGSDTRVSLEGLLFVALKGDQFDAHDFLVQAIAANAKGLLVHSSGKGDVQLADLKIPVIQVADTLLSLQALARSYRKTCKAQFVGITGSNGKTSTKEFATAIVSARKRTHSNKGSLNNHWGVPFNLLQVEKNTEVVMVEMGMNHAHEIELLVGIAQPTVVVCTMVGTAHMEHFGSIEGIAKAKEEIYAFAPTDAQMIFNLDNVQTHQMYQKYQVRKSSEQLYTFSESRTESTVQMKLVNMELDSMEISGRIQSKEFRLKLNLFGYQNLTNLMAAACVGLAAGLSADEVIQALPRCQTTWGRNQKLPLKSGATLLFDAYNANPDSMKALLSNLSKMPKTSVIGVFGQMRELGEISQEAHYEIGQLVGKLQMKEVFFIGDDHQSFCEGLQRAGYPTAQVHAAAGWNGQLQSAFEKGITPSDLVVMKASRGTKLEQFLSDKVIDLSLLKKS